MGKQPYTEARKRNNKKWDDANLKTCTVRMRLDIYADFEKYCINKNISKNKLINELIRQRLELDGYLTQSECKEIETE